MRGLEGVGMAGQRFEAKRERTRAEAEQLCFHGLFWLALAGLAPRRQFFSSRADLLHAARSRVSSTLALKQEEGAAARQHGPRKETSVPDQEVGMHAPTGVVGCTPGCLTRRDLLRQWSLWGGCRDRGSSGVLVGCNTCNGADGQRRSLPPCTICALCTHDAHTSPSPVIVTLPGSRRNSLEILA